MEIGRLTGRKRQSHSLRLAFIWAYRIFKNRLRCWAHLLRKAKDLNESLNEKAKGFGENALAILEELMAAIFRARDGPHEDLEKRYRFLLEDFRECCQKYKDVSREKTRALAREFLNDWEAIFRILANPMLRMNRIMKRSRRCVIGLLRVN